MNFDEKLIQSVQKNRVLYDIASRDYTKVKLKDMIWEEIADALNSDVPTCRKRWRSLRDTYKKCKRDVELKAEGAEKPVGKKKWKYYDRLGFLDNIKSRKLCDKSASYPLDDDMSADEIMISNDSLITSPEMEPLHMTPDDRVKEELLPPDEANEEYSTRFPYFMGIISNNLNSDQHIHHRSTYMLFETLACKIAESNLPKRRINEIERKVTQMVFDEIDKDTHSQLC